MTVNLAVLSEISRALDIDMRVLYYDQQQIPTTIYSVSGTALIEYECDCPDCMGNHRIREQVKVRRILAHNEDEASYRVLKDLVDTRDLINAEANWDDNKALEIRPVGELGQDVLLRILGAQPLPGFEV